MEIMTQMNTTVSNYDANGTNISVIVDYYGTLQTSIYGTWLVIIIAFSIIGNILVMLVICMVSDMHSAENGTNIFLFYLAISDLMTGIFIAPVSLYTLINEQWHFGTVLCSLNSFLNTMFLLTSIHILMYISIHKYLTVKRLSHCDTLPVSKQTCFIMIGASWLWGIAFALLTTVGLSEAEYKVKTTQCGPKYPDFTIKSVSLSTSNLVVNFAIPFCIMLIMYLKIYYIMKDTAVFRNQSTRRASDVRRSSGEKAAINTLIIVITCFVVCWLPYVVYSSFVIFTPDRDTIPAFFNPLVSKVLITVSFVAVYDVNCSVSFCHVVVLITYSNLHGIA